ncbi:MAG: OsmC family protein [Betaproteobacteria bacterium]|nr:OsmC family protein [Betaproteobacteria bacterium]
MNSKTPLAPIDKDGLEALAAKGKSDPSQVRTVKCRTVAEGRFRHLNYIRGLDPHIIDEPPQLLGDDTAPNPSEAALAALGTCICVGIHANAGHKGIVLNSLELELEADINITSVWGVGDLSDKLAGFSAVRIKANIDADVERSQLDEMLKHVLKWSPVTGTYVNPVPVTAQLV